jgi:hypothetical protein
MCKEILKDKPAIIAALKQQTVFAIVPDLDASKPFVVRDARFNRNDWQLEVKLLEGWRKPQEVYIEL